MNGPKQGYLPLIILFALAALASSALGPALAADACKECREFHKACVLAHSQAACKVDYDICMKHCRK